MLYVIPEGSLIRILDALKPFKVEPSSSPQKLTRPQCIGTFIDIQFHQWLDFDRSILFGRALDTQIIFSFPWLVTQCAHRERIGFNIQRFNPEVD